jgi:hypothetical protein
MRIFLAKLMVFSIALFSLLIGLILLNRNFANFKIKESRRILIIGNSHSESAYNDSLINDIVNLSQSAESYFYTYFKTKKLIEQNPKIQTVLIEFSNINIDEVMNEWIWGERYMSIKFPIYGSFMDINSYSLLLKNNPKSLSSCTQKLIRNCIKKTFTGFNYQREIGHYLYLERDKTDSLLANLPPTQSKNNKQKLSEQNIAYLRKTINFLISKNKKVFLIRSPVHKMSQGYNYEERYQQIVLNKFSDVEFLDFSKYPLTNSEFGDLDHLNHKGAKKFSYWFNIMLSDGLLEKSNKQQFIESKMME